MYFDLTGVVLSISGPNGGKIKSAVTFNNKSPEPRTKPPEPARRSALVLVRLKFHSTQAFVTEKFQKNKSCIALASARVHALYCTA
jgi:hypothetical protein